MNFYFLHKYIELLLVSFSYHNLISSILSQFVSYSLKYRKCRGYDYPPEENSS